MLTAFLAAIAGATKILPLGDSITFGCGDSCVGAGGGWNCDLPPFTTPCSLCSGGWRQYLWRDLQSGNSTAADATVQFVGTQLNGPDGIDKHHEGHPGWQIPQIGAIQAQWAATQPDVILRHLGTNDMGVGLQTGEATATRMRSFLNHTFRALPKTRIMLASVIGAGADYGGLAHAAYNAALPGIAADFAAANCAITFVDMARLSGIGPFCDDANCCPLLIHPTLVGYEKMASVWHNALKTSGAL